MDGVEVSVIGWSSTLVKENFFFLNDGLFSEISKFKELRGEVWE